MPLIFNPDDHSYELDGEPLLSVSRVLELSGIHAPVFYDEATANLAAQRGTALHRATELLELGTLDWSPDSVDPIVLPYVRCYERFLAEHQFEVSGREVMVYSAAHRYAGTFDRIGVLDGAAVLMDVKTSVKIEPWMGVQLALYAGAEFHANGLLATRHRLTDRIVLHLQPDTVRQYHLVPFDDPADFAAAESAVVLARWVQDKMQAKRTRGEEAHG